MLTNLQKNAEKKKRYLTKKNIKIKIIGFSGGNSTEWLLLSTDTNCQLTLQVNIVYKNPNCQKTNRLAIDKVQPRTLTRNPAPYPLSHAQKC